MLNATARNLMPPVTHEPLTMGGSWPTTIMPKKTMYATNQKAQLQIKHDRIQMSIDSQAMWESLGLYGPIKQSINAAKEGPWAALEGAGETGELYRSLMDPKAGRETFANIAIIKMGNTDVETTLAFLPSVGPDISWSDWRISVDFIPHRLMIEWV